MDPKNDAAQYQICLNYINAGNTKKAITLLEYFINTYKVNLSQKYAFLGELYEQDKQVDKANECYRAGVKANPDYERNYYNISLLYLAKYNDEEAEKWAIEALKRNNYDPNIYMLYMRIANMQAEDEKGFYAACNFLLLEPNTERSVEVSAEMRKLMVDLHYAALSPENAEVQLKQIFTEIYDDFKKVKPDPNDFFRNYYVDYFYNLSKSNQMPVFSRLMALANTPEQLTKWAGANKTKTEAFYNWMRKTPRKF
ncbi:hypothetical protein LT679_16755 [Mucilaginibacter roseus]|uniref:Tetratricopeptide repeat protein n=1 Tax=Mucilaginibacter roseus TaxID=1528868 RepID=A0ABS8U8X0_9SPHI|nr:hypothetical protein [Mucilaginibacter roseus]